MQKNGSYNRSQLVRTFGEALEEDSKGVRAKEERDVEDGCCRGDGKKGWSVRRNHHVDPTSQKEDEDADVQNETRRKKGKSLDSPISAKVSKQIPRNGSSAFSATLTSVRTIASLSGILPRPFEAEGETVERERRDRTSLRHCVFSRVCLASRVKVLWQ